MCYPWTSQWQLPQLPSVSFTYIQFFSAGPIAPRHQMFLSVSFYYTHIILGRANSVSAPALHLATLSIQLIMRSVYSVPTTQMYDVSTRLIFVRGSPIHKHVIEQSWGRYGLCSIFSDPRVMH